MINFFEVRAEVAPVAGGSPTKVWRSSDAGCDGHFYFGTGLGWNHASDAAAFTLNAEDPEGVFAGRLIEWQRAGATVRSATIPATTITGARYAADDRSLTLYRVDIGLTSCQEAAHDLSSSGFGNLIGNPISVSPTLCTFGEGRTVQPDLRQLAHVPSASAPQRTALIPPRRVAVRPN